MELEIGLAFSFSPSDRLSSWNIVKEIMADSVELQHVDVSYGNVRRRMLFVEGVNQKKDVWIKKETVGYTFLKELAGGPITAAKLKLSEEIPTSPPKSTLVKHIRIKRRWQLPFEDGTLEIDLAKTVPSSQANLKTLVAASFTGSYLDINVADWDELRVEFEMKKASYADISKQVSSTIAALEGWLVKTSELQQAIHKTARMVTRRHDMFRTSHGLKRLLSKVVDLDVNTFTKAFAPRVSDYYITDKADGVRTLLVVNGKELMLVNNTLNTKKLDSSKPKAVVDCELVVLKSGKTHLLAFDILLHGETRCMDLSTEVRLEHMKEFVAGNSWVSEALGEFGVSEFKVKTFSKLGSLEDIRKFVEGKQVQVTESETTSEYNTDGVIFTKADDPYMSRNCYKWKPPHMRTIDFYAVKVPDHAMNMQPFCDTPVNMGETLYVLMVTISKSEISKLMVEFMPNYNVIIDDNKRDIVPIQFSTSSNKSTYMWVTQGDQYDKQIVEMGWAGDKWTLHRLRTDRADELSRGNYFGNYYSVAELTWQSILNPLTYERLTGIEHSEMYFMEDDNTSYKSQRVFNSHVKSTLLKTLWDPKLTKTLHGKKTSVIDLASGKGQDMNKYADVGASRVLFVDNDSAALDELVRRKHTSRHSGGLAIFTLLADLTADSKETIKLVEEAKFRQCDLIVCNFAIHYLASTQTAIQNMATLASSLLADNGRLLITCFDGKKVFDLISRTGSWAIRENNVLKYSIVLEEKREEFMHGTKIKLILPFTQGDHVEESLVDLDMLAKGMASKGLSEEARGSFSDFAYGMKKMPTMSPGDETFVSLYSYLVFNKNTSKHVVIRSNLSKLLPTGIRPVTGGQTSKVIGKMGGYNQVEFVCIVGAPGAHIKNIHEEMQRLSYRLGNLKGTREYMVCDKAPEGLPKHGKVVFIGKDFSVKYLDALTRLPNVKIGDTVAINTAYNITDMEQARSLV